MNSVYIAVIITCILFIFMAHFRPGSYQFYLGSGRYGHFISAISIVAAFTGGGALINTASLASQYGHWAFFDVLPAVIGLLISAILVYIGFFGKRFSDNFFDIDGGLYDRKAVNIHYAQTSFLYILVIAAQLRAVATVAAEIDIQAWLAILLCCATVAAYAFRGFDAVTRTDVAQLILMLPMYFLLAYLSFEPTLQPSGIAIAQQVDMPIALAIALCLPIIFLPISQEIHQRGAAVETDRDIGKSYFIAAIIYLLLGSLLVFAFAQKPTLTYAAIIKGPNPFAAIVVTLGLLAAILSTLDTSTNIASHAAQKLSLFSRLPPSLAQILLLTLGSLTFLYFKTVLSLILFALFVYMAGPALTFIAIYSGIHPRISAVVGTVFVGLHSFFQFKGEKLIDMPLLVRYLPLNDSIRIGLILLISQIALLIVLGVRRRLS